MSKSQKIRKIFFLFLYPKVNLRWHLVIWSASGIVILRFSRLFAFTYCDYSCQFSMQAQNNEKISYCIHILSFLLWYFKEEPKIPVINKNKTKQKADGSDRELVMERQTRKTNANTVDTIPTETPITFLFKRQRLAEWIINPTQLHTTHYTHPLPHIYVYTYICIKYQDANIKGKSRRNISFKLKQKMN